MMAEGFNPPLQVVGFIATRRGDAERGPAIRVRPDDAKLRGVTDGALVWIYGPRRHDLATAILDDTLPRGGVIVRDVVKGAPFCTSRRPVGASASMVTGADSRRVLPARSRRQATTRPGPAASRSMVLVSAKGS